MNQLVGQLEVGDGVHVGVQAEVLVVAGEAGAQTVILIDHGGHAVEAEAVEVVLLLPELQVGQQEVEHLHPAVIEQLRAPGGMPAALSGQEVLVVGAVQLVQTLAGVRAGVGVHHVQQYEQVQLVGLVDEILQILRIAVPGGCGVEIRHLIAEGGVVGMLLNGHQLHRVVAQIGDALEVVVRKFTVGTDALALLTHADVGLVDHGRGQLALLVATVRPDEAARRRPDLAGKLLRFGILHHTADVGRDAVEGLLAAAHLNLHALLVLKGVRALQLNLPHAVLQAGERMGGSIPVVEIADQMHLVRAGQPLAIDPAVLGAAESVVHISIGEGGQIHLIAQKLSANVVVAAHAQLDVIVEGLQPGIDGQDLVLYLFCCSLHKAIHPRFIIS